MAKISRLPLIKFLFKPYFFLKNLRDDISSIKEDVRNVRDHSWHIGELVKNINILSNITFRKQVGFSFTLVDHIDTIKKLAHSNCSFIRFGDSELTTMNGGGGPLQGFHPDLSNRLMTIWKDLPKENDENLMVGVIDGLFFHHINATDRARFHNQYGYSTLLDLLIHHPLNMTYYSGSSLRMSPYQYSHYCDRNSYLRYFWIIPNIKEVLDADFLSNHPLGQEIYKEYQENLIQPLKSLWKNRNVIVIEGDRTFFGVYNDLFDNIKSVTRIIGPNINAFDQYHSLLDQALDKAKKLENPIFVLSLGATATVLAYDLHKAGYRALDLGNCSIFYDIYSGVVFNDFLVDDVNVLNRRYKGNPKN